LKPKDALKGCFRVSGSGIAVIQYNVFVLEENVIHRRSKPADPVRCPTLIGLDLPLASLVGITEKRKKLLTCTQENKSKAWETMLSKAYPSWSKETTTRHAKALRKAKGLISLLVPIKYY
jgi:hypothetical protein